MQSLTWPEKKGPFGGRTSLGSMFFIEGWQFACPPGEILLLSGMILSMELCNIISFQTLLSTQRILRLPFGSSEMKAIKSTASTYPCLGQHTMNSSYCSNTLIHYLPLTFAKRALGISFGDNKFTLTTNIISISLKTCSLAW
jgi:hypothetical protein